MLRLSEADEANSALYKGRADAYRDRLRELDVSIREKVASLPQTSRKLVTDHKLFGYFADEYGFEIIGTVLPAMSTSAEASARHISVLVDLIEREQVSSICIGATAAGACRRSADNLALEL